MFASFGLVKELASYTVMGLNSHCILLRQSGMKHILSLQHHPVSNGAAERAVQMFKKAGMKQTIEAAANKRGKSKQFYIQL